MIDYLNVRRSLIYLNRNDLKDFGVHNPSSINHILFSNLKEISLLRVEGAKEIALRCFNNAYYICTLIQLEDFPELRVADYEQKLLEENKPFREDVCAASMAMVCKLLSAYDAKWMQKDNDLIKTIQYRFSHFQWMHIGARNTFSDMIEKSKIDGIVLPRNEFAPRDIIDAINNVREEDLAANADYICERLALLGNPRKKMFGADMAIARMNDCIREMEEIIDGGYPSDAGIPNDFDIPYHTAIDYIKEHYPEAEEIEPKEQFKDSPHAPETEDLLAQIRELESKLSHQNKQLMEANNINTQQAARIAELEAKIQQVSAENEQLRAQVEEFRNQPKSSGEWIVELFAHLCYGDEQVAKDILNDIRDKEDPEIADIIIERKQRNQISPKAQNREIWKILHAAKLYRGIEGNFNTALRRRQ